jgi:hypothetical protein
MCELLSPYAHRNALGVPEVSTGSVSGGLGLLAATMGRWDEATRHFEDAIAMNTRMGARPWVARAQHDYAAMRLTRDAPEDRQKARELLALALRRSGTSKQLSGTAGLDARRPGTLGRTASRRRVP